MTEKLRESLIGNKTGQRANALLCTSKRDFTPINEIARLRKPVSQVRILPGHCCEVSGHRNSSEPALGSELFPFGAFGCSCWLVVLDGVEGEFAEELAGGGVDDPDV